MHLPAYVHCLTGVGQLRLQQSESLRTRAQARNFILLMKIKANYNFFCTSARFLRYN
jgi:hypothetical protein